MNCERRLICPDMSSLSIWSLCDHSFGRDNIMVLWLDQSLVVGSAGCQVVVDPSLMGPVWDGPAVSVFPSVSHTHIPALFQPLSPSLGFLHLRLVVDELIADPGCHCSRDEILAPHPGLSYGYHDRITVSLIMLSSWSSLVMATLVHLLKVYEALCKLLAGLSQKHV